MTEVDEIRDMLRASKTADNSDRIERLRDILNRTRKTKKPARIFKNKIEYWKAK